MKWIIAILVVTVGVSLPVTPTAAHADDFAVAVAAFNARTESMRPASTGPRDVCICGGACKVCGCEYNDCLAASSKNPMPATTPANSACRCGLSCGCDDCVCTGGRCECIDCGFFFSKAAYWAFDPRGGGFDLCDRGRVIGYLYSSGKFRRRNLATDTWGPLVNPPEGFPLPDYSIKPVSRLWLAPPTSDAPACRT